MNDIQKPCGKCDFVSETGMELENHIQEKHDQNKDGKEQNVNNDKTTDTSDDIFECDLCDFKTLVIRGCSCIA